MIDRNPSNFLLHSKAQGEGVKQMRIEEAAATIPMTGVAKGN
ncbi:MAG TPA: hypothetical protein VJ204_10380 [Solirubrobacterales bacterium]|nr:hypothetical protein [Solirubrobacterales bacterium]